MSRMNRKSGLELTPEVFRALHKALIAALYENYKVSPDTLVDYQLYGFNYYDENLPSIKKLILDKTGKWVNGKYLYNKYREWKNGVRPIKLTREFVFVYFKTLGYRGVRDFIVGSSLSEAVINEQINLEKPMAHLPQNEYYIGYFIGEEGTIIKSRLVLSERSLKAQWELAYWEKEEEYSEYLYEGIIQYQQNGMSLIFKNEDTVLDRSLFIGIFCERQVKVKPFLIGSYSGYDRNRQPTVGEVIFQRVASKEEQNKILKTKEVNPIIAQYLSDKRWTVTGRTPQSLLDLSAESKFAHAIDVFVQNFMGVFVAIENGVFTIELNIKDSLGNASLSIAGHPLYKGTFKVQASGQLLVGQFTNATTKAPLFMSIEVLPIREHLYTGDLLGISRFDKSFSGKIYLSSQTKINEQLPKYRGSELTPSEIENLPEDILSDLSNIVKNKRLEKHFRFTKNEGKRTFLQHLVGTYCIKSEDGHPKHLNIHEDGISILTDRHLVYTGKAMMCEGGILSIYFTDCNGIPNCGQIMAKVGKMSIKELAIIKANWFHIDDNYEQKMMEAKLTPI